MNKGEKDCTLQQYVKFTLLLNLRLHSLNLKGSTNSITENTN